MIPKTIHYCWFGHSPLPSLAQKCIASWKKFLPEYEIKEWNEDNFDVNIIPYTKEAYSAQKYAFVSDYARFWILYKYGGLYFDTDVEVIRPLDDISDAVGKELTTGANPGLGLGCAPGLGLYKKMLDYYAQLHFDPDNITETIVGHTTKVLRSLGLQDTNEIQKVADVYIYPSEYFNPTNIVTHRLHITDNTRTIHWYAGTWMNKKESVLIRVLRPFMPEKFLMWYNRKKHFQR